MATVWAARPSSSAGYWRGGFSDGPFWQGQGAGQGPASQGVGQLPPGSGQAGSKAWTPTIIYLFVFVVAELVLVKCLEKVLR